MTFFIAHTNKLSWTKLLTHNLWYDIIYGFIQVFNFSIHSSVYFSRIYDSLKNSIYYNATIITVKPVSKNQSIEIMAFIGRLIPIMSLSCSVYIISLNQWPWMAVFSMWPLYWGGLLLRFNCSQYLKFKIQWSPTNKTTNSTWQKWSQ